MVLFENANHIKWGVPGDAVPSFFVLILVPFTYSIIAGVGFGYVMYICIGIITGSFFSGISEVLADQKISV